MNGWIYRLIIMYASPERSQSWSLDFISQSSSEKIKKVQIDLQVSNQVKKKNTANTISRYFAKDPNELSIMRRQ